jgi:WhiB family redox-sensing transcriptional regulator
MSAEWMESASCAGVDSAIFFVDEGRSVARARSVCRACPVRQDCLDYALTNGERYGVWGGLTERERCKVVRGQTAPDVTDLACADKCGTTTGYDRHRRVGQGACADCLAAMRERSRLVRAARRAGAA